MDAILKFLSECDSHFDGVFAYKGFLNIISCVSIVYGAVLCFLVLNCNLILCKNYTIYLLPIIYSI